MKEILIYHCDECNMKVEQGQLNGSLPWHFHGGKAYECRFVGKRADTTLETAEAFALLKARNDELQMCLSPKGGHPEFHLILEEMRSLHVKKGKDYGTGEDPLHNIRAGGEFVNIPAWQAALLRGHDKMVRIKKFIKDGQLANESVEDSLLDGANYLILGLILLRESKGATS